MVLADSHMEEDVGGEVEIWRGSRRHEVEGKTERYQTALTPNKGHGFSEA